MSKTNSQQSSQPAAPTASDGPTPPSIPGLSAPSPDPLQILADALKSSEGAPKPVPPKREKGKPPKNLEALAHELELDVAALYDIEVPSAREGEAPFTFGKLKDLAAERDTLAIDALRRDSEFNRQQSELIAAQNELDAFVSSLPKEVLKPEVLKKFREKYEQTLASERSRTLDMISEWRDPTVRAREIEQMVTYLEANGFPRHFLTHVHDARMIRFIRNNWRRDAALQAALEKVKEVKPTTPPKSRPTPETKPRLVPGGSHDAGRDAFAASILKR